MLFIESIVKNIDNSGILLTKIIHVYKNNKKTIPAKVKDLVLIASQKADYRKLKKKKITKAIIAKTIKNIKRKNGHYLHFKQPGVIVLNEQKIFKGTKIKGPIAAELRFQEIIEIVQTAKAMI